MKRKVVNIEVTPEQFQTIAAALKMCASWLEDMPECHEDIELAKKIREARKEMLDSAEENN